MHGTKVAIVKSFIFLLWHSIGFMSTLKGSLGKIKANLGHLKNIFTTITAEALTGFPRQKSRSSGFSAGPMGPNRHLHLGGSLRGLVCRWVRGPRWGPGHQGSACMWVSDFRTPCRTEESRWAWGPRWGSRKQTWQQTSPASGTRPVVPLLPPYLTPQSRTETCKDPLWCGHGASRCPPASGEEGLDI